MALWEKQTTGETFTDGSKATRRIKFELMVVRGATRGRIEEYDALWFPNENLQTRG